MYGKGFLGNMTENLQADCVQSRQAGFMQCFLIIWKPAVSAGNSRLCRIKLVLIRFQPRPHTVLIAGHADMGNGSVFNNAGAGDPVAQICCHCSDAVEIVGNQSPSGKFPPKHQSLLRGIGGHAAGRTPRCVILRKH